MKKIVYVGLLLCLMNMLLVFYPVIDAKCENRLDLSALDADIEILEKKITENKVDLSMFDEEKKEIKQNAILYPEGQKIQFPVISVCVDGHKFLVSGNQTFVQVWDSFLGIDYPATCK